MNRTNKVNSQAKILSAERVHSWVITLLQLILSMGLLLAIKERHWQDVFTITCITLGAAVVALVGYFHLKMDKQSVFDVWIKKFVDRNPQLFTQKDSKGSEHPKSGSSNER